jgi:sulfide:quinone oxidoreductase
MRSVIILGAGTAGTMAANKLRRELNDTWDIVLIDNEPTHYYQPGFLFIPFGTYQPSDVIRTKKEFIPKGVRFIEAEILELQPDRNKVVLANGQTLSYDFVVVATGTHPNRAETPGLDSEEYGRSIHDFYTFEGAVALREAIKGFKGGRLVVNLIELPIKCPVAPLEFSFLADAYFEDQGIRDDVEITYVTPLEGPFTKPVATARLGEMFTDKNIKIEPDFYLERVDAEAKKLISFDEREVPYDLLVTVPVNMGAAFVGAAGIADELNHVKVDAETFVSADYPNLFALGDAAALPTSKAGAVAHFAMETFIPNFVRHVAGKEMVEKFDGHANCYIETGHEKAMLIDFNYTTEPLPGKYPVAGVGPFKLLAESTVNHWGKLAFRWMYWNLLLKGRPIPVSAEMKMTGKEPVKQPTAAEEALT